MKAKIRITIHKRKHHKRILRNGHYISPATESISIILTPAGGSPEAPMNYNLSTASNPECVVGIVSSIICTLTLTIDPGTYTGSFTTYDGPLERHDERSDR